MTVFTIGHGRREELLFLSLLEEFDIERLVDVRSVPASRFNPQFNRENLERRLPLLGVEYLWMGRELGGLRKGDEGLGEASPNKGWDSPGFRVYADHMQSDVFQAAAAKLAALALEKRTAFMCAEQDFSRCHRQMIADYLVCQGWEVQHIVDKGILKKHALTPLVRCEDGKLSYPGDQSLFKAT
jgi:uncharacterized protein (DUF488 family)